MRPVLNESDSDSEFRVLQGSMVVPRPGTCVHMSRTPTHKPFIDHASYSTFKEPRALQLGIPSPPGHRWPAHPCASQPLILTCSEAHVNQHDISGTAQRASLCESALEDAAGFPQTASREHNTLSARCQEENEKKIRGGSIVGPHRPVSLVHHVRIQYDQGQERLGHRPDPGDDGRVTACHGG